MPPTGGPPSLTTLGDLRLGEFRKVKALLMVAYTALEGPTPRRLFRTWLWPSARQPEDSLRVALHGLRKQLPQVLTGDDRLEAGTSCDAAQLLNLRGEAALAAYGGAFLQGVTLGDVSPEFEDWAEAQRARLARHVQEEALLLAERSPPEHAAALAARAYRLPGAPPAEEATLRRLLALSLPGTPLEAELRAELQGLTGPDDPPTAPARTAGRMLGRAAPLDALLAWAAGTGGGLAAVSGPGGIGKSTLARELLRELSLLGRAVTLVDAEGAALASDLLPRLASARAPGQAVRGSWAGVAPLLGPRPVVVLDGVDDLSDLGDLLRTLRRELPGVRWVLTGRRSRLAQLGAPAAEQEAPLILSLGGLDVPVSEADLPEIAASPAVALFVREAGRVRRDFALGAGNAALIAGLTRRLLGHPLALTLAASWLRVEELDAVYARILREAGSLQEASGDGDGRRGLVLVAARSWALLTEAEQHAALRLQVAPDFDPADAPALGVGDAELDALLAHSFVETYQPGSERLRLYPALSGLMVAQARAHPGLTREAQERHRQHYLGWFAGQAPEAPAVDAERGNIRQAVSGALASGTLDSGTVNHLLAHYDRRGVHDSGTDVFATLADQAEDAGASADVQAALQIACMWLAYRAGRLLDAQTLAARFLQGPHAADPTHRMKVLNTLAAVRGVQGQSQAAADLLRQTLKLARQVGDNTRIVMQQTNLLMHLSFAENSAELYRELADLESLLPGVPEALAWNARRALLGIRVHLPDVDLPALLVEATALTAAGERSGDMTVLLYSLLETSRIHLRLGQLREAGATLNRLRAALSPSEAVEIGADLALLETRLLYASGRAPQARRRAQQALKLSEQRGNPWELVELFLTTLPDLQMRDARGAQTHLAAVAGSAHLHFDQRRRAREALEADLTPYPPLDLPALRAWLGSLLHIL